MAEKLLFILFVFISIQAQGQETWSLEKCLEYAETNNIILQQSKLQIDNAALDQKQAKFARYPNLNASSSASYNIGRAIDPSNNDLVFTDFLAQNYSLSSGVNIYSGLIQKNTLEQSKINLAASQYDLAQSKYDLGLNIARAYLGVLLAEEQLRIANNRVVLTNEQLDRTKKLINAGALARSAQVDIETQIALDEQSIIATENAVENAYLALKTTMNLDPSTEISIEEPEISANAAINLENLSVEEIFNLAVKTQPGFKADALRIESAEKGIDIAKGSLHPTLSAFASVGTQYANLTPDFDKEPVITNPRFDTSSLTTALIDGLPSNFQVVSPSADVSFPIRAYAKQLNDNLSYSIGLSLNVPIFNGLQARIGIERAELNLLNTQLLNEQSQQTLRNNIQQALFDAKAAKRQLDASDKTLAASKKSYENAEKRFNAGATGIFEYTSAKNAVDSAEINRSLAKYDYIFKLKIIDYYLGNSLTE